jgi:hypothetical protein
MPPRISALCRHFLTRFAAHRSFPGLHEAALADIQPI